MFIKHNKAYLHNKTVFSIFIISRKKQNSLLIRATWIEINISFLSKKKKKKKPYSSQSLIAWGQERETETANSHRNFCVESENDLYLDYSSGFMSVYI